jgi:predicted AAA+ superfamily ATPase
MLLKSAIEHCYRSQQEQMLAADAGMLRDRKPGIIPINEFVHIITGIRRCGKSTLLHQLMSSTGNKAAYFNFEDPRIHGFALEDFEKLDEVMGDMNCYFFDEIQNVEKWELFIRQLHDRKKIICITGSNASLLSRELGTRLTGRSRSTELFPFSFTEFCRFLNLEHSAAALDRYLENGGFPSYLKTGDVQYLQQLFRDIIYRDIIIRYGIRNARIVEEMALFLLSNTAKEFSLNNLKKTFGIGSANSVSGYISWFEDSYLLFSLPRFSWSARAVSVNPKKIYAIDSGLANATSLSFSGDKGRLLENLVFLQLRRKYPSLYYYRGKTECDFVVREKGKIISLIQVCSELHRDNLQREMDGLLEAMNFFELQEGTIITRNQSDRFQEKDKSIQVVPAWQWLGQW